MASIRSTEGRRGALQSAPSDAQKNAARLKLNNRNRTFGSIAAGKDVSKPTPTPFYIAAKGNPNTAPAPVSSSPSIRSVEGRQPSPASSPSIRSVEGRKGSAEASPSYVPKPPTFRPNVKIAPTAAPTSSGGSSTYKAPTASSAPAPSTTSSTSTRKYETGGTLDVPSTTSGGTAGTVKNEGPSSANYGGMGRGSGREGSKTNRQNPRRSRSTTMDELKKRAAKQLGI